MPPARGKPPKTAAFKFPHSDALLHNVLESGSVATVLNDLDGRVTYANRAFCELLDYEPEEVVGLMVPDLVHPDFVGAASKQFKSLVEGKVDGYRAERQFLRKDGEPIWILVSASLLRNERTGRPLYLIAQLTDIDRQKRAEAALAESESRMNYALEAARQGVWDHNVGTDTVHYSRMWRLMRGFAPDEEVDSSQASWLARLHPEDRERVRAQIEKQDRGVDGYDTMEYRERHRDGHYIWILSRGRPVEWDVDGNPIRTVGTDTDITRLKATESQLAEEKERLRVTLASIGDGVISTDAEGRVLFMNPVAEKMTGWQLGEAVGQRVEDVFDVVDEDTGDIAPNPVTECLAREEPFRLKDDVVLVSRTGERRDVRDSAAPVRTPDGKIIGAVLVFQDVTQSRILQRQLEHSAMHDSLTGLPNRSSFERVLVGAIEQARRELREHALCFVDLDRFKTVNDTAGHAAGDALLKEVAKVIRKSCRAQDFTARIGGDEFAVVLCDCSMAAAKRIAEQMVAAIGAVGFPWGGSVYRIGASIGIAAVTNGSPDLDQLLSHADAACYAAKAAGRNRVAVFETPGRRPDDFKQIA
jgi:diguanylate cyclase (GGDEF)-like protein/PAS domain S-box-containing protein